MKMLYMFEYIYIECSYTSQHTSGEDLVSVILSSHWTEAFTDMS